MIASASQDPLGCPGGRSRFHFWYLLVRQVFEPGVNIICEGDEGHTFFIIREGEVKCTKAGVAEEVSARLVEGNFFGELALLRPDGIVSTPRVVPESQLMSILPMRPPGCSCSSPRRWQAISARPRSPQSLRRPFSRSRASSSPACLALLSLQTTREHKIRLHSSDTGRAAGAGRSSHVLCLAWIRLECARKHVKNGRAVRFDGPSAYCMRKEWPSGALAMRRNPLHE